VLGRGAAGTVFLAQHIKLDRLQAIKVLKPQLASDPATVARFQSEAQNVARIQHENLVRLHNFGEERGYFAFVMEYVEGQTLAERVAAHGPFAPREAAGLLRQVCAGLAVAHKAQITHRDIKPENLLVTAQGQLKVADFGVARSGDSQRLTQEGQTLGTPPYMSPEQCRGQQADHRSDLYSLGLVGYYLMTGKEPMLADSAMATMYNQVNLHPDPPHLLRPEVGPALSAVICRMLSKKPEQRQPDASTVIEQLQAALGGTLPATAAHTRIPFEPTRPRIAQAAPRSTGRPPVSRRRPRRVTAWRVMVWLGILGCGILLGLFIGARLWRGKQPPEAVVVDPLRPAPDAKQQYVEAMLRGDKESALEHLNRYLASHPTDWPLLSKRLDLTQELRRPHHAIADLEALDRAAQLNEGEAETLLTLYLQRKQFKQATALLARFLLRQPSCGPGLSLKLVALLEQQAQIELAIEVLDREVRRTPAAPLSSTRVRLRLAVGRAFEAARILLQLPSWPMEDADNLSELEQQLRIRLGKKAVTQTEGALLIQLAGRDVRFFFWFALADWLAADLKRIGSLNPGLLEQLLIDSSRDRKWHELERAAGNALLAADPQRAKRIGQKAKHEFQQAYSRGEFVKAVKYCTRFLVLNPRNESGWSARGDCYLRLGQPARALADASEALRIAPGLADALSIRGRIRLDRGQYAEAIQDLNAAIKKLSSPPGMGLARAVLRRGLAYLLAGKPEPARVDLERCYKARRFPVARLGLALAQAALGKTAAAQDELGKMLPGRAGRLLARQARYRASLKLATRLIELLPQHPLAHAERGNTHLALGDRSESLRDLEQALKLCKGQYKRHSAAVSKSLNRARVLPK